MNTIRSICVYCGSSPGRDEIYAKAGHLLGTSIAEHGMRPGLWRRHARHHRGRVDIRIPRGKVTGIIPRFLINKEATETALGQLSELIITPDMHERKHKMFERADAFVALPGGIGTLEEIVEVMTWAQLGRHRKPMVFANVDGFWDPMLSLLDHMAAEGFIHTAKRVQPLVINDPEAIVAAIMVAGLVRRCADRGHAVGNRQDVGIRQ